MRPTSINGNIICDYIKKFPKTSNLALARKIFKENFEMFDDVDQVRERVRYFRGSKGETSRHNKKNRFNLPKSDNKDFSNFIIPNSYKKGLIISDVHIPYHDIMATKAVLEYAYKIGIDFIFLNGDIIDFYQISRFIKDPRKRSIKDEISALDDFINVLKKNLCNKIYYKFGNHEERWDTYMMQKSAEIYDLDALRLEEILKLKEKGVEWIKDKRPVKYHNLMFLHGHEYRFSISNPVNPARGLFLRTHYSTLGGHFHQTSEHSEPKLNKDLITCWSIGCLCGLNPEYMPLNKWNHGFAIVRSAEKGFWRVENKKIIKGKIV